MNINEAKEIFLRYYPNLPLDVKKAVKFTLENWDDIKAIPTKLSPFSFTVDTAKIFLRNLPALPTDARKESPDFIVELNAVVNVMRGDLAVWLSLEDFPHEEWRDVIGNEGLYQVSNYGRVKSFHNGKVIIRKSVTLASGYQQISLDRNGDRKCKNVHELVAKAFLPNPEGKPIIDHRNRDTGNNCVWNLNWVTNSENQKRAVELGSKRSGCDSPRSDMEPELIREIRRLYVKGSPEFGAAALAKRFGKAYSTIKRIVRGESYKNVI